MKEALGKAPGKTHSGCVWQQVHVPQYGLVVVRCAHICSNNDYYNISCHNVAASSVGCRLVTCTGLSQAMYMLHTSMLTSIPFSTSALFPCNEQPTSVTHDYSTCGVVPRVVPRAVPRVPLGADVAAAGVEASGLEGAVLDTCVQTDTHRLAHRTCNSHTTDNK